MKLYTAKSFMRSLTFIFLSLALSFWGCKKESTISAQVTSTPYDLPPIADAGSDFVIYQDSALLYGALSSDPDEKDSIVSYEWNKILGPDSFNIDNKNEAVTKVRKLIEGVYEFELSVKDTKRLSSKDTVKIIVINPDTSEQTRVRKELVFSNLEWKNDPSQKYWYMQTPLMPEGYSVDSIMSVLVYEFDFDLIDWTWKSIQRDGMSPENFYYKTRDNVVIVYSPYVEDHSFINPFIGNQIKVTFQ